MKSNSASPVPGLPVGLGGQCADCGDRPGFQEEILQVMKRALAALLIAGFCVLGTGCAECGWVYEPFGPGTLCTGAPCDGGCGGCAAPACAPYAAPACTSCAAPAPACSCEPACGGCGDCGDCDVTCANTCASPCGPLTWLFSVLNGGYCGDGCGEIWWGDFHSAPPTCCEPCNRHGEWTGQPGGVVPMGGTMGSAGCSSCGGGSTINYTFQNQPRVLAGSAREVSPIQQAAKPIETVAR